MSFLALYYCSTASRGLLPAFTELLGVRAADSYYLFARYLSEWQTASSYVLSQLVMNVDEGLGSFELFIGVFACLIAAVLALSEVRRESEHKLWWKIAAVECAITGFILMLWLTVALLIRVVSLAFGAG